MTEISVLIISFATSIYLFHSAEISEKNSLVCRRLGFGNTTQLFALHHIRLFYSASVTRP